MANGFTGTGFALNNLIGGVIGAQGPRGQYTLKQKEALEDKLEQTRRTREFISNFDFTQENATEEMLKGVSAIDPAYATPLMNLLESERLKRIREERLGTLSGELAARALGGTTEQEYAEIRGIERGLDLEATDLLNPFDKLRAAAMLKRAGSGGGKGERSREEYWIEEILPIYKDLPGDLLEVEHQKWLRKGILDQTDLQRVSNLSTRLGETREEIDRLNTIIEEESFKPGGGETPVRIRKLLLEAKAREEKLQNQYDEAVFRIEKETPGKQKLKEPGPASRTKLLKMKADKYKTPEEVKNANDLTRDEKLKILRSRFGFGK